jgi:hypothetical protein
MDNMLGMALWSGSGFLVAGIVGHLRGAIGTGMLLGLILGPLFGPLAVLFATRESQTSTASQR